MVTNVDPKLRIIADRQRIEQAFMNLISNAYQAIQGEGEVKIRAFSSNDGKVKIRIRDTGKGISPITYLGYLTPFSPRRMSGRVQDWDYLLLMT